jgi:PAS domain S-box-containing protein
MVFIFFGEDSSALNLENALEESELKYRRLFETAQDAILILDGDSGKVTDANTFILDLLGYPREYFVGKLLWELGFINDKSIAQQAFTELKTRGYIRYEDLPLQTKDGKSMDVEFISNVYLVGDKKIIQCNIRDITERRRVEQALALAGRKLNLLSGITRHDINNQVTVIVAYLEILEKECPDPSQNEYVRRASAAAYRILSIVRFAQEYESLGVHESTWQNCRTLVDTAAKQVPLGKVTVKNDLPGDTEVFADPLIVRVFYNLMDNAVKYGGKITTIRFSGEGRDNVYVIRCEDDGAGVPPEEKEHIFKRGFGKNTGLGLTISRDILAITGITIQENGEFGAGARFEMTIPKTAYRLAGIG